MARSEDQASNQKHERRARRRARSQHRGACDGAPEFGGDRERNAMLASECLDTHGRNPRCKLIPYLLSPILVPRALNIPRYACPCCLFRTRSVSPALSGCLMTGCFSDIGLCRAGLTRRRWPIRCGRPLAWAGRPGAACPGDPVVVSLDPAVSESAAAIAMLLTGPVFLLLPPLPLWAADTTHGLTLPWTHPTHPPVAGLLCACDRHRFPSPASPAPPAICNHCRPDPNL